MSTDTALRGRNLTVDHHTRTGVVRALENVDIDVEAASSVAIMGPSGCGKSTLLGLLAGLAVPTSGSVTIGGENLAALSERDRVRFRRRNLGMVYQADNLLPHLTVHENVALQLAITNSASDSGTDNGVADLLTRLGIGELGDRLPDQLSGGQRQRAAVARAVVHRPSIVLADEPTGSLDADSADTVVQLLVDLHREMESTFVMVTHDPAMAEHTDRIVRLEQPSSEQAS